MSSQSVAPFVAERAAASVRPLSIAGTLTLHLVPGVLMTAGFIAFAPIAARLGFPPIAALMAAILLVLIPTELGILVWAARREGSTVGSLIPYRRRIPLRTWAWLVPGLILLAFLGFGLHQAIEPALIERFFGWLPDWYVKPIAIDNVTDFSRMAWLVTFAAYFTLNGLLGPIVEEIYFRGYLLPRMDGLGRWAPLVNVTLFSIYHLWSPWQIVARVLGLSPTVYAVRWQRNIVLGMIVHCSLNLIGVTLVASMVFARV